VAACVSTNSCCTCFKAFSKAKQVQHELASTAGIGFDAFKACTTEVLSPGEAWGGGGGGVVVVALLVTI
jgi:hypothetical protein